MADSTGKDWVKLHLSAPDSSTIQAAITDTPYALQAFIWAKIGCGKARADRFEATAIDIKGAARKYNIGPDDMLAGIMALHNAKWLVFVPDADEVEGSVTVHNWAAYQSEYMRRAKKAGSGRRKRSREVPDWATAIIDELNAFRVARGGIKDKTMFPSGQGVTNLRGRADEGIPEDKLHRCMTRYLSTLEPNVNPKYITHGANFYGTKAHFEAFLSDDWEPPRRQVGTASAEPATTTPTVARAPRVAPPADTKPPGKAPDFNDF